MYAREKLCREQTHKSRKSDRNPPSFSSTLLDEIYRSIDGNVEKSEDLNGYKETASSRRACLVEKWIEKEVNERAAARKLRQQFLQESDSKSAHESDFIFFSSTSSSSDSSGALSASDTEFFGSTTRSKPQKVSCFTTRPKPVRTGTRSEPELFKFDDHPKTRVVEDDLIKSKSRALKIYANLKKVKQPISPGGRLTSFINSLFSNANGKKSRNLEARDDKSATGPSTACSSASSFSRSCLSKYSPRSREKMRDGERRTVRFEPASVVVDEDLRPGGHKGVYSGDSGRFGRPPLPPAELKLNKKVELVAPRQNNDSSSKSNHVFYNVEEDEEDCLSDSSSDLFELDHLALFASNRYIEELPVYETTHFDTNCAIASGLIR